MAEISVGGASMAVLPWCMVLTVSLFGVLWSGRTIYLAVGVYLLDVGMHRQLEQIIWTSAGVATLCAGVAFWSARGIWKRMTATSADGMEAVTAGSGRQGLPGTLAAVAVCLIVAIAVAVAVTRMLQPG
ncbi:MAG: hypothetical protein F4X98_11845 [Gammaproteobacteria bacterium]|nr:hypothetical protein [Gammaproteobacteria bacterium]